MAFSNFEFRMRRTHALPGFFYITLSKIDDAAAPRVKFDDVGRAGEPIGARIAESSLFIVSEEGL